MTIKTWSLIMTGVCFIGAIEIVALSKGINGTCLAASVGAIAAVLTGAPSYLVGKLKGRKEAEDGKQRRNQEGA